MQSIRMTLADQASVFHLVHLITLTTAGRHEFECGCIQLFYFGDAFKSGPNMGRSFEYVICLARIIAKANA